MLADEHDATREAIEAIAGQRIELMAAFRPHDFHHAVVVVATCGVDWHTCRLVDDNHVLVLVDDADGLRGDGGFMAMECVADDVAVLDGRGEGWDGLSVDLDGPSFYGVSLRVSVRGLSLLVVR